MAKTFTEIEHERLKAMAELQSMAAQQNMLGGVHIPGILSGNVNAGRISAQQYKDPMQMYIEQTTIGRFEVRKVQNGFILRFAEKDTEKWTEWIAVTVEDLAEQFVKILVETKLDHK